MKLSQMIFKLQSGHKCMVEMAISIFFIIFYVQWAIINKVCKPPELCFLSSAHPITVLYISMKFHENISKDF